MSAPAVPAVRGGLPLVGHALSLYRDPVGFLASLPARGDLVRIRIGPVDAIMVCDADLAQQVFRDDRTFDKGGPFSDRAEEIAKDNLVSCPHALHRRKRRLVQPAFAPARMPAYAGTMAARIAEVVDSWRDGDVVDVPAQMTALTTNVLTSTMFADLLDPEALRQSREDADAIVAGMFTRMLVPPAVTRLPLPANRRFDRARTRLRRTVAGIVAARRVEGGDRGDLLSALLVARDAESAEGERALSDDEIVDLALTLHLAGSETTATTLTWALHLLAGHPEVERRLHAEVDEVLAGRPAGYADVEALAHTGRIVTETLRVRSPGWLFTRVVTVDTTLGGHRLPAGTTIAYSPYLIHHRADLYADPERFDPDRWDPALHAPPPRTSFLPFANGARRCVGDRFSLVESVLALASIAARVRFEHLPGAGDVRPAAAIVMRPRRLRMRVLAR
ncbi:cytochrome P450 [Actinosynnema sp. NPDC020468]|uniref:cytochrome P450 n=1 Tax=Actinosynnema sp. NPDC020468 TaxID=3154488 RepID=UPI0033C2C562